MSEKITVWQIERDDSGTELLVTDLEGLVGDLGLRPDLPLAEPVRATITRLEMTEEEFDALDNFKEF